MKLSSPMTGSFINKGSLSLYLLLIIFLLLLSSFSFSAEREDYDLDDNRYIEINDLADLDEIRNNLAGDALYGSQAGCPEIGCVGFELTTNLDFDTNVDGIIDDNDEYWDGGYGWLPIGSAETPFTAEFHGRNFSIQNLYINRSGFDDIGFFSFALAAKIEHLIINGLLVSISGNNNVGIIAGRMQGGYIENVSSHGVVKANNTNAGGLVGLIENGTQVTDSSSRGSVLANNIAGGLIGAAVGEKSNNVLTRVFSFTEVESENNDAGGLIGKATLGNTLEQCFYIGNVNGQTRVGGLIGNASGGGSLYLSTRINNCFATGAASGSGAIGGLAGYTNGFFRLNRSFSSVKINSGDLSGGVLGSHNTGVVSTTYWSSDLSKRTDIAEQDGAVSFHSDLLKCPIKANVNKDTSNCFPVGSADDIHLYLGWENQYTDKDSIKRSIWNFGSSNQFPGLNFHGEVYRDSDGDGSLDSDDTWPLLSAAHMDSDQDGYPDKWSNTCDADCQLNSGLIIDQLPNSSEAWLDADYDQMPDAWALGCDIDCQSAAIAKGLLLDKYLNDFDNDGLNANDDPDEDGDGKIDADRDHDGLIEIYDLVGLNAIRNNLQGTGYTNELNGETDNSGCPIQLINGEYIRKCSGYELMTNLNLDTNQDGLQTELDTFYNENSGWKPIGYSSSHFSAIFEGNNNTINGLYINRESETYIGLFGSISDAEIRNLNIKTDFDIRGNVYVGTLAGQVDSSIIKNISTNSSIKGGLTYRGGLIGYAKSNNIIDNCRSHGEIEVSRDYTGGLIGRMLSDNVVSNSFSTSNITGYTSSSIIGGLIGSILDNNTIISNYSLGNINGYIFVGGLIGKVGSSNNIIANYFVGRVNGRTETGGLIGSISTNNNLQYNYAAGPVSGSKNTGGLIGWDSPASSIIENNYWATDTTNQLASAGSSNINNYIGLTSASLKCATSANESEIDSGCVFDNDNEAIDLPIDLHLYKDWELAGFTNEEGQFEHYWDFGTNQEFPALVKDKIVRRDLDADGVFNQNDFYVDISLDGRTDTDNDGIPDVCNTSCLELGMIADNDVDGDGVNNDEDEYPNINSSDLIDSDNDGIPNDCNYFCEQRGLLADNDDDNDLIPDLVDAFPLTFEIAVDADKDGLPDAWTDTCNIECRNASDIVLDLYLNDFDNDGLVDGEDEGLDTDLTADNGLPVLLTIPEEANTQVDNDEGTVTTFNFYAQLIDTLTATDVVDDALTYEAKFAEHTVLIDPTENEVKQLVLPSGRQVITWTAIDDAGNRSNSLQQVINVYPRVRFATTYSQVEENTQADIKIELTAIAPFYPVHFEVKVDSGHSTINNNDFVSSAQIDITQSFMVTMLAGDSEVLNTQVELSLPIAQDNIIEEIERVSLELLYASDDVNGSNYFTNIKSALVHTLDIREESFDDDGDGILDVDDAFSLNAAASVDSDNDGQPDSWNANCDFECYSNSNLTLDLDDDNDGTPDTQDLYPLNAAVAIDNDNDGLPDHWAPGCDVTCQNNSGFTLDQYLNDSDNDGLINALDSQHGVDSGKPILTSVPGEMSSAVNTADSLHAKLTIDMVRLQKFSATDAVDTNVYFRPLWNGNDLAYENGNFELPIGRQVIQWVAIDDAGNRSDPMEQVINVYPEIQFNTLTSVTGEGATAQIQYELTGPSPVYPVKVGLKISFENASARGADIQDPANDSRFISKTHYFDIDAGQGNTPNTQGVFEIPIASDGIDEDDEFVFINILSIENVQVENNYFAIVDDRFQHKLTITDENLAPEVALEVLQRGISVDEIDVDHGEVVIRAVVSDPNGDDRHTYEWDLAEFGLNMEIANTIRMDPKEWVAGEYEFSIEVSDTGNPVMSAELNAVLKVVKSEDQQPEENGEEDPVGEEENPGEQAGESPANEEGGEASSDSSSGSGALGYGLFLLLLLSLYHRQRISYKY